MHMHIGVEGPFGVKDSLHRYSDVVMFGSGSGIADLYSYAADLVKARDSGSQQQLDLIWVVRHSGVVKFMQPELDRLSKTFGVRVKIYISQGRPTSAADEKTDDKASSTSSSKKSDNEKLSEISYATELGRPKISDLVTSHIQNTRKSVAFVGCGHGAMIDELQMVICNNLSNRVKVDYYELNQQW